ncbi:hypothetical protein KV697_16720 [Sphingomonas sanguinis]|uniref:Uncharacterized protein n=1 Tax=Sphingomonas sanguinis TaxID=33051 RepID=A0ABU5LPX5_9SPHN|nr:hypothetical protein [Sphingomonas sanguinis]MDZ7281979.1 hypothetical protein [Sphingomonas sanguinis]QXT35362.1 hypothetical protein KV697_16720 [Sphingomonas sanguinis]
MAPARECPSGKNGQLGKGGRIVNLGICLSPGFAIPKTNVPIQPDWSYSGNVALQQQPHDKIMKRLKWELRVSVVDIF